MPKLDPDAAAAARMLAARLELERSLGVAFLPVERPTPSAAQKDSPSAAAASAPDEAHTGKSEKAAPAERPHSRRAAPAAGADCPEGHTGPAERIEALEPLRQQALSCTACGLSEGRTHVVFGEGALDTDLVFVGEAPGRDEDEQGRPFVGRAGQLLTRMIEGGLKRSRASVYICNILKCRPPGNRDPRTDEVAACTPYLKQQLAMIQPKVIVALGRIAGNFLTGEDTSMGALRGKWWTFEGLPLRAIYHPSYLLRQRNREGRGNPADRKTLTDLQEIARKLQER